jgi:hypothetical protein
MSVPHSPSQQHSTGVAGRVPAAFALGSAALLFVGGLGPWATAFGIEAPGEGPAGLVALAGLISLVLAGLHLHRGDRVSRQPMFWIAGLGCFTALVTVANLTTISSTMFGLVQPGWGLQLAFGASLTMVIAAVTTLVKRS